MVENYGGPAFPVPEFGDRAPRPETVNITLATREEARALARGEKV